MNIGTWNIQGLSWKHLTNKRNHFLTERAEYGYNSADGNKRVKARRN